MQPRRPIKKRLSLSSFGRRWGLRSGAPAPLLVALFQGFDPDREPINLEQKTLDNQVVGEVRVVLHRNLRGNVGRSLCHSCCALVSVTPHCWAQARSSA